MEIQGKVIDIEFEIPVPKNGGGSYLGSTLTYKDDKGKVQTKSWVQTALNHAANAHVKAALQTFTKGTNFVAESVKNDAGFWNWTDVKIVSDFNKSQSAAQVAETKESNGQQYSAKSSGGNWQTAEERAQTQLYIIRQNAITNAVNLLKDRHPIHTVDDVLNVAKEFEMHVLGIRLSVDKPRDEVKTNEFSDLENDIPLH